MSDWTIRPYTRADAPACFEVFRAGVQEGAAPAYSQEERNAWCPPDGVPGPDWAGKLDVAVARVALRGGAVIGFMTLHADGYLDFAYVRPDERRSGLAGALYEEIEAGARTAGITRIDTEASHLARRFFAKRGWQVDAAQHVIRRGVAIANFRMSKGL